MPGDIYILLMMVLGADGQSAKINLVLAYICSKFL